MFKCRIIKIPSYKSISESENILNILLSSLENNLGPSEKLRIVGLMQSEVTGVHEICITMIYEIYTGI